MYKQKKNKYKSSLKLNIMIFKYVVCKVQKIPIHTKT